MFRFFFAFILLLSFLFTACPDEHESPEEQPPPQENPGSPQGAQGPSSQMDAGPVMDVSDEELEMFVDATFEIREQRLDPQQERSEMQVVVENAGLEMERYEEIQIALMQDPELQQKVQQKLQDVQDEQINLNEP